MAGLLVDRGGAANGDSAAGGGRRNPVPGSPAPARPHLDWLDGLRGVAILMVLLIHASLLVAGLPAPLRDVSFYGVRGVQLFFVVSGYTLMVTHRGRPLDLGDFATRRFFRIAPMFYLGMALYLILAATTAMPLPTRAASGTDIAATLLFVHGWVPSAVNTVVPGGWSIAAEAMFYCAFPLLLRLAPRPRLLLAVTVASYAVAGATNVALRTLVGGAVGEALAFPFWLVHFPAFAGGCRLATIADRRLPDARIGRWLLALAVVGLLADSLLRGRSNLLVAIALMTLLTFAAAAARPRWLERGPLPWLGRISFSVYILHFAALGMLRPFVPAVEAGLGPTATLAVVLGTALAVTVPAAALTWHYIEAPFVRLSRRLGARRVVLRQLRS